MDQYQYIQSKLNKDAIYRLHQELYRAYKGEKISFQKEGTTLYLTPTQAHLGLSLMNCFPAYREENEQKNWHYSSLVRENGIRHQAFLNKIGEQLIRAETQDLLWYFFGEEIAPLVLASWDKIDQFIFQRGYYRRSFRRPHHRGSNYVGRINFLIQLINTLPNHDLTIEERLTYNNALGYQNQYLSYVLLAAGEEWEETFLDVIYNRHPKIKVSRTLIIALLATNNPKYWKAVGDLLLAAQRQEGLRQIILEAADHGHIGAFKYLIQLIIDEKLSRFSATLRAVETWIGLGWQAEKESTIRRFLTLGHHYLQHPQEIPQAIHSKDNAEIYMALWAQGVINLDECLPLLRDIWERDNVEKRTLVLLFATSTNLPTIHKEFLLKAIDSQNKQLLAFALSSTQYFNTPLSKEEKKKVFQQLEDLLPLLSKKKETFTAKVFAWTQASISKDNIYHQLLNLIDNKNPEEALMLLPHFDNMPLHSRERIARIILGDFYTHRWRSPKQKDGKDLKLSPQQKEFALMAVTDRSKSIQQSCMEALKYTHLEDEEIHKMEGMLKRKSAGLRKAAIQLLSRNEKHVINSIDRLIQSKNTQQRLAALDMIIQLQKKGKFKEETRKIAIAHEASAQVTNQEEVLLTQILNDSPIYNRANGFGLYDPNIRTTFDPIEAPQSGAFFEQRADLYPDTQQKSLPFGLSKSVQEMEADVEKLKALYLKNKDYEYTWEDDYHGKETVLLGNVLQYKKRFTEDQSPEEQFALFPLHQLWQEWIETVGWTAFDLYAYLNSFEYSHSYSYRQIEKNLFPKTEKALEPLWPTFELPQLEIQRHQYHRYHPLLVILRAISRILPYPQSAEYRLGMMEYAVAHTDIEEAQTLKTVTHTKGYTYTNRYTVLDTKILSKTIQLFLPKGEDEFRRMYRLLRWRDDLQLHLNSQRKHPYIPPAHIDYDARAYQIGMISKDELIATLMNQNVLGQLTQPIPKKGYRRNKHLLIKFPYLKEFIPPIRDRVLEIELKRGDNSTEVTHLAMQIHQLYGQDYFFQIIKALGATTTLNRGYIYRYGGSGYSKKEVLSTLLKRCRPIPGETQENFNQQAAALKYKEKRWVELAMYAQQWAPFIQSYLGWEDIESAVWWLHAHTNAYHSSETESEIARFTNMPMKEFQNGGVDVDWFYKAYKKVGKSRWKLLYDSAKYISSGHGHSRAKLYADVLLRKVKIREVTKRVKEKRNQDYLRVYGLVPLSKKVPEKDLLHRYLFIQQFIKESKQFGAQRQESEKLAAQVALDNLARTAGFPDPMRLTWAMESQQAQAIFEQSETLVFEEGKVEIALQVDEEGKPQILSQRNGKRLKNIPAKYKKHKQVKELKSFVQQLRAQYSRSRKSLEEAMVRKDAFLWKEIITLLEHPVIQPLLHHLVFKKGEHFGFARAAGLMDTAGKITKLSPEDLVELAHVTDLHLAHLWTAYQKYCFDQKIKQPFKQIFRELYLPTADELHLKTISKRYEGHQVQPQKAMQLLKSRGWRVNYEDGLQRVYHKEGIIAQVHALANWFTPADIESPTLETITFFSIEKWKPIPFTALPPVIFSEVMRDMDLVVSVAHVGDVDPESSQSSMEMRGVLVKETARLFKLHNIKVEGRHVHIHGTLGDYSVHLGSAMVFQKPGRQLGIIPVHSQHRGRIFLPFADDDPKSAELLSKVLMLAKDNEIQDPTILSQLNSVHKIE